MKRAPALLLGLSCACLYAEISSVPFSTTPFDIATAVKRTIAYQIQQVMEARQISKSELAAIIRTSRSSLDPLPDPDNRSVTLLTLETAAHARVKKLRVQIA